MKNKMSDVRDHLVAMLEQLGDPQPQPAMQQGGGGGEAAA